MNIDDLCWIDDEAGISVSASSHQESQNVEAIRTIYTTSFAPGLDRLLETHWFSTNGWISLISDRSVLSQFENYVAAIPNTSSIANQEARLVWALLCMCRRRPPGGSIADFVNGPADNLDGDELASKRLDIVEALITAKNLSTNPLPPNAEAGDDPPTAFRKQLNSREHDFWFDVGAFVSTVPASNPNFGRAITAIEKGCLYRCRTLLDSFENRDVLYSIMLMRHIGETYREADVGVDVTRDWSTAYQLLTSQSEGRATNVVMTRFCSMALRPWAV